MLLYAATALAISGLVTWSSPAAAGSMTVHVGPPSVGSGGSNPVSIPPVNPLEYELIYVTDKDYEFCGAISPGLLFGKRSDVNGGLYVSFGGGLIIDGNGSGLGGYSAFGWETKGSVRFNAEYKQALGYAFGRGNVLNPFAIRLGVSFDL